MTFQSPTQTIPDIADVPRHVAIIMDGNGRWAKNRFMPRVAGHKRGVYAVRESVKACGELGVEYLTLFAFSSENWRRPQEEVTLLMQLFLRALENEVAKLHENNIRFKVIGDLTPFDARIRDKIAEGEALTANNDKLTLTVAANYGGRWDILNAMNKVQQTRAISGINASTALFSNDVEQGEFIKTSVVPAQAVTQFSQTAALQAKLDPGLRRGDEITRFLDAPRSENLIQPITEAELAAHLSMAYAPEPDLFIRTGGEERISNFLLWQLAYTEFYFTPELWPDFGRASLEKAIASYQKRERRFGRTSEQLIAARGAATDKTSDAA